MENVDRPSALVASPRDREAARYGRDSFVDSVLTDAALDELKKQSVNGCLLCELDALDAEEWE
jgi:hypothetical protein